MLVEVGDDRLPGEYVSEASPITPIPPALSAVVGPGGARQRVGVLEAMRGSPLIPVNGILIALPFQPSPKQAGQRVSSKIRSPS